MTEFNRADYMAKRVSHEDYYRQFVTVRLYSVVGRMLGDRIKASTDKHLNDVPLGLWDTLAQGSGTVLAAEWAEVATSNASTTRGETRWLSLSDQVCVLKAAGQMIREGVEPSNN